uniref:Tyrosinase_Cu-bd domain-containing protein n=1 Tax=Globodera pallida TaxID=36090 RepID=A0A183C152_GLOPA
MTDPKVAMLAIKDKPILEELQDNYDPCKKAPTKALRLYCTQLYRWDQSARFAPSNQEAVTLNPLIPDAGLLAADIAPGAGVSMNSPGGEKAGPNIDEGPPPIPPSAAPPPSSKTKNIDEGPPPIPQSAAPPPSSNTKNIDEGPPPLVGAAAAPPQVPSSKADFDADAVQPPTGPAPPQKGIVSSNVDPCDAAPTKSQHFVCQKLFKWDKNARAAPPLLSAIPKMPSIAGVPPPDFLVGDLAPIAATPYQCMDLGCLCRYIGGNGQEGSNVCQLANGQPLRKALRKEYRMLTDDERARYHAALKAIKKSGEYDNIARIHSNPTIVGGAHSGPAFLPWHREYLKRMEIALRQVDPTIAIPYWDSSLEAQLPTPADSHLFTKEFMGSTDEQGNLVYGHFANWKTIDGNPNIRRRVGGDGKGFTEDEINWFLNQVQIDQIMTYSAPQPGVCAIRMEFRWMESTANRESRRDLFEILDQNFIEIFQGIPPFIYLLLNRTVRRDVFSMFARPIVMVFPCITLLPPAGTTSIISTLETNHVTTTTTKRSRTMVSQANRVKPLGTIEPCATKGFQKC